MNKRDSYRKLQERYAGRKWTGPKGSPELWRALASQVLNRTDTNSSLSVLGFKAVPTLSELTRRRKELMKKYHPDKGGNTEYAAQINSAYLRVKKMIKG